MSIIWAVSPDGGCELQSNCIFDGKENCRHSPLPPPDYIFSHFVVASDEREPGVINKQIAHIVRWWNYVADYPGEDFYAWVWFEGGKFRADVFIDHQPVGIEEGETIEGLVAKIRAKHGGVFS